MSKYKITHTDGRLDPQAPNVSADLLLAVLTEPTKQVIPNQFPFPSNELNLLPYLVEVEKHHILCTYMYVFFAQYRLERHSMLQLFVLSNNKGKLRYNGLKIPDLQKSKREPRILCHFLFQNKT